MEGGNVGGASPGLLAALNHDALEEVFTHCTTRDLLALRQSCRAACELLGRSEKVWVAKLRESFGLGLKAHAGSDGLFVRLARRVYEASSNQPLRFQGVFVNGGVDEDAMHYFVDNLFRPDKAPYCSNCSRDADCIALLLDGEVPRDAEFARVRQYMIRRCLYAAALIMNVQMPEHNRDPDSILHLLDDWTDIQLEGFFRDLVLAMQADHALGRLLVHGIDHERVPEEQQRILGVHQWLLDRPKTMKAAMLKSAGDPNLVFDTSVLPKLTGAAGTKRMAGVVHEVTLSRVGNLTCPVAAGAVLVGTIDHSKLQDWSAADVLALLREAAADPAAAALSGLLEANEVSLMAAAGQLPPILCTDETMAGVWHEFDTSDAAPAQQAAAAASSSPHLRMTAQSLRGRQQRLAQEPQPGAAEETAEEAAAAAAAAAGPSNGTQQRQVSPAGIISWRPLLWFKFHSAEEAVGFVQRNRPLVERHGAQATVRHSGPAPTRRGHVTAQAAAEAVAAAAAAAAAGHGLQAGPAPDPQVLAVAQMLHQQVHQHQHQHPQLQQQPAQAVQGAPQQAAQPMQQPMEQQPGEQQQAAPPLLLLQQQQPLPAQPHQGVAQPPPPGQQQAAEPAGGAAVPHWPAAGLAGGPAAGHAAPPEVPVLHSESDSEDESEGSDGLGGGGDDDLSDDSGSDLDEGEGAQGAWLANWVHDEFGADLQEQDVVVAGEGLPFDAMDEDESSEEDEEDEDALLPAEEHFALPAGALDGAGAGAGAGPAAAAAAAHVPQVQGSAAETLLRAVSRRSTRARNRLRVPLTRPAGGNILLVKLINQENLMEHYGDPHTWPNIDMTLVSLAGRLVELPEEAHLAP